MYRPLVLAVLATFLAAPAASAYEEPIAKSYTRISPDGAFVFVMLAPPNSRPTGAPPDELANKYPLSGMYRNDGLSTPLWVFSEGYVREAYPASDGRHVVAVSTHLITLTTRTCGNSPEEPPANPVVLTFYKNGEKVRDVRIGELLDHVVFCKEHGPGWHPWLTSAHIDDAEGVIVVQTVSGTRRFSLATGRPAASAVGDEPAPLDRVSSGLLLGIGLAAIAVLGTAAVALLLLRSARVARPVE
ncbi:MAG TPA: hypothetical protein VKE74_32915 [Gemmataceae bacterium]|nr:hypothetical protein [Gemmataceae bacterium]